jgi:hypothetical protein
MPIAYLLILFKNKINSYINENNRPIHTSPFLYNIFLVPGKSEH